MTNRASLPNGRTIRPALPPAILAATVLVAGASLVGSDWFMLIRYAVSILALITAVIAIQHEKWWWALPMVPIAVLWNPVWPIELPDVVWASGHYVAGLGFIALGALLRVRES
jgi:hypothetical protein